MSNLLQVPSVDIPRSGASTPASHRSDDGAHAAANESQTRLVFYMARVEELEAATAVLQASLDSSRQREAGLLRSLEGYKGLHAEVTRKRDALQEESDGHQRVVSSMTDKVSALLTENEHLRTQLRRLEQATAANPAAVDFTASSAFNPPDQETRRKARSAGTSAGGAWAADPSQMAALISSLENELSTAKEQLRIRTAALNDALQVIHQLSTSTRPDSSSSSSGYSTVAAAASYAVASRRAAVAYATAPDGSEIGSAAGMGKGTLLLREKVDLQMRVKQLEHDLTVARAGRKVGQDTAHSSIAHEGLRAHASMWS